MQAIMLKLILMLIWNMGAVSNVRITELRMATHLAEGSDALLGCSFELDDEALYSLKWYKDGYEFFRFVPKASPPMRMRAFHVPGVVVDLNRSSVSVVALKRVTQQSAGTYQCEVKGEAPNFTMVTEEKNVIVDRSARIRGQTSNLKVIPKRKPEILGLKSDYTIGSQVTAYCMTSPSRPEATLTWLVNDQPVPSTDVRPSVVMFVERPFVYQAKSLLNFTVQNSHYDKQGALSLKCQATIPPLYHQETEYTFHDSYQTTTEISTQAVRSHVAATGIPIVLLILQMMLFILPNAC